MSERNKVTDKEILLVREVFGTPAGAELLQMWVGYHVRSPIADRDLAVMATRVGKLEFVTAILNCLEGG